MSKADLLKYAQQHGADESVCATLERLPDQTFEGPVSVSKAIGELDREGEEATGSRWLWGRGCIQRPFRRLEKIFVICERG